MRKCEQVRIWPDSFVTYFTVSCLAVFEISDHLSTCSQFKAFEDVSLVNRCSAY